VQYRWLVCLPCRSSRDFFISVFLCAISTSATPQTSTSAPRPESALAAFQHSEHNRNAFARPASGLSAAELRIFHFGNRLFNTNWVQAPASAVGFDGLGPTFNRVSCSGCHTRDGRGRPPVIGETELTSLLLRVSVPGISAHGAPKEVPGYGTQINDRAIPGVSAEAGVAVRWIETQGRYADGSPYRLRRPVWTLNEPAFGAFPKDMMISARAAPAVFGLGLLEAVPEAVVRAQADPADADGDGISGRINLVYSAASKRMELGRFGWKAGVATLIEQNAGAAQGDIGITTALFPEENCPPPQRACAASPNGGTPELSSSFLDKLTLYVQMLGVPTPRPFVGNGAALFARFGCAACHRPELQTAQHALAYTDLLLHDMGPGLADDRPEFAASGQEWRTAPLWGVGLIEVVNGHQLLLHDGRARGIAEAILWHGGEAEAAKEHFRKASRTDREALIEFVRTR
jgi:CxxC motif-containing protein (DUF1111 family)